MRHECDWGNCDRRGHVVLLVWFQDRNAGKRHRLCFDHADKICRVLDELKIGNEVVDA